jgi:hypothetical protein
MSACTRQCTERQHATRLYVAIRALGPVESPVPVAVGSSLHYVFSRAGLANDHKVTMSLGSLPTELTTIDEFSGRVNSDFEICITTYRWFEF